MLLETCQTNVLGTRYNLFSKQNCIPPPPDRPTHKQQKREIKLVFYHPNLLFLDKHKRPSKDELSKQSQQGIISSIQLRRNKLNRTAQCQTADKSQKTGFSRKQKQEAARCKTSNAQPNRQQNKKKLLVLGRSQKLKSENIEAHRQYNHDLQIPAENIMISHASFIPSCRPESTGKQKVFDTLEKTREERKIQTWGEMWHRDQNRHAVRLDMYLDIEKKYHRYCRGGIKPKSAINALTLF